MHVRQIALDRVQSVDVHIAVLELAKCRALGGHGLATEVGGLSIVREEVHLRTPLGSAALPPLAIAKCVNGAVAGKDERVLTAA